MSGLILLLTLALCIWAGVWLVRFVGRKVPNPKWKAPVMVGLSLTLLTAPFVDEVIGMYQFEALCKANGIESADVSKARGKRVRLEVGPPAQLNGTITPGKVRDWYYKDAGNNDVLIHHKSYSTPGGWLVRYTPLSMGSNHPMLFQGGCPLDYSDRDAIFEKNQITKVN